MLKISPQRQLFIAQILITIGALPLLLIIIWISAALSKITPSHIPLLDPFAMIGIGAISYAITFFLAGASALWSWNITNDNPEMQSITAISFRRFVMFLLALPFFLVYYSSVRTH